MPDDLKVRLAEQKLYVLWMDGRRSEYSLPALRRACPCASCRGERAGQQRALFPVLKTGPASVKALSAKLVGTYAIKFTFSDGHDTGIYNFRYLRRLDVV